MKTLLSKITLLFSLSPLLLLSLPLNAQVLSVSAPGGDQPVFLRFYDGKEVQRMVIPDWKENPVVRLEGQDATHYFDLSFINEGGSATDNRDEIMQWVEPGVPVEGDLPSDAAYSKDGSIFAFIYQNSDNVIFYDATTYETLATVQIPRQPVDIKMGQSHAYICCHAGLGLVVISLEDYSISNWIPVDINPCQVELNPAEDTAYIACATFTQGQMVAVDLKTNEVIYTGIPFFHHYGWTSEIGRTMFSFTKFWLSPDGSQFIAGQGGWPVIFDAQCHPIGSFSFGGLKGAAYSRAGDSLYIYSGDHDTVMMYLINTADLTVIDSIYSVVSTYFEITDYSDIAFSGDGSKVIATDCMDGQCYLFDFNSHSCQVIEEPLLGIDPPIITSHDGEYAVLFPDFQVNFIRFANGLVYNSSQTGITTIRPGCVSPAENKLVVGNLPFYILFGNGNETLYSIDFNDINNMFVDTAIICGETPEADAPNHAAVTEDGTKILSANDLTHNLSVISLDDFSVDTLVAYEQMSGVKMVPKTNYALVYGMHTGNTKIISVENYKVIAELPVPDVRDAYVSSDGQYAYLVVYQGGSEVVIFKIVINGAASYVEAFNMVGGCLCEYWNIPQDITIYTNGALSPDNSMLLIGSDDPVLGSVVNIIDTETLQVLKAVRVFDPCIFGFAFTDDSKRAIALMENYPIVPIIYLDGENSYVENDIIINGGSFSGSYNPFDGYFYVLEKVNRVDKVDPLTGEIIGYIDTYYDMGLRISIDNKGMPMVLTNNSLIYDRDVYPMPGVSTELVYDSQTDLFISPVPGPDVICVFDPKMVGIQQFKPGNDNVISVFPNPATDQVIIRSSEEITRVKVCNIAGAEVYSADFNDRNIEIPTGMLAPGVYVIDVVTKSGSCKRKMVVRQ